MQVRTWRERVRQAVLFELGGIVLVTPLVTAASGLSAAHSAGLLALISLVVLAWTPLHNAAFDRIEGRLTGRLASARPHGWRIVHALSIEGTVLVLTCPIIMQATGLGLWHTLMLNAALTLAFVGYAYVFYLAYDRLLPLGNRNAGHGLTPAGPAAPAASRPAAARR